MKKTTQALNGSNRTVHSFTHNPVKKNSTDSTKRKITRSPGSFLPTLKPDTFTLLFGLLFLIAFRTAAQAPVSNFTLNSSLFCINQPIQLTSTSSNTPTSWSYSVNGAFVSSLQNPSLTFTATGSYTLSLIASNSSGAGSLASITISVANTVPLIVGATSGTLCSGNQFTVSAFGAANYFLTGDSNSLTGTSFTVSPAATTTYTIFGVGSNGCPSSTGTTFTVSVLQSPSLAVNSGSICAGSSFTFSPTGGTTYTYSGGSAVVSPTQTSQYSVTTTGTNGCVARVISTVVVQSAGLSVTGNTPICNGSALVLTALGAASYTWSTAANTSTISVSPNSSTNYSVIGLAANGCSAIVNSLVNVTQVPTISVTGNTLICNGQTSNLTGTGATGSYSWSSGTSTSTVALNPSTTTNYTLTGVSGPCSNTTAVTVSVNAVPSLTVSGLTTICAGQSTSLSASGANSYNWSIGLQTQSIILSPTVTTVYMVTGTSANCSNSAQVTVSVNPAPIFTVNSGMICSGKVFTISPAGALSYTYSGGSATVMPSASTNYVITGMGANGCTASMISSVIVNPRPNVTIRPSVSSICVNQVAVLTAGGASTYSWNTGSTNFALVVTPNTTTNYTLTGTDLNGCVNTATAALKVTECVGVSDQGGLEIKMSIYPNPSTDQIRIRTEPVYEQGRIEIFNALGEMLLDEPMTGGQTTLNLALFAKGVYFIRVSAENRVLAQSKLIKE